MTPPFWKRYSCIQAAKCILGVPGASEMSL